MSVCTQLPYGFNCKIKKSVLDFFCYCGSLNIISRHHGHCRHLTMDTSDTMDTSGTSDTMDTPGISDTIHNACTLDTMDTVDTNAATTVTILITSR